MKNPPQVISTCRRYSKPLTEILSRPKLRSDKEVSRPLTRSKSFGLVRRAVRDHRHSHSQLQDPPRIELTLPARIEPSQLLAEYKDLGNRNLQADVVSRPVQRAADAANPTESLTVPKEWLKRVSIHISIFPIDSALNARRETQSRQNTVTSQIKLRHSAEVNQFIQRLERR